MTPELKKRWIAALRGGEFNQGLGRLRSPEGRYCCLGVLCVVAGIPISPSGEDAAETDAGKIAYKPIYQLGMSDSEVHELWSLNDNGRSFAGIADYIEQNIGTESG